MLKYRKYFKHFFQALFYINFIFYGVSADFNIFSYGLVSRNLQSLDMELGKTQLGKGMWEVSRMACAVENIAELLYGVCCEQEWELDTDSELPAMLADNVEALAETLLAMVDEETRELLAHVKEHAAA